MYEAIITTIQTREHPNADRLLIGDCLGFTVVVGKNTKDGELGIFFPADGQLSDDFCIANNLYPLVNEQGNRIGGGFISRKDRRVKAQNFRQVNSEGFWVPMSYLNYLGNIPNFEVGDRISSINGNLICNKWISPATRAYINSKGKKNARNRRETPWLTMHPDTKQLRYELGRIPDKSTVVITEKCHGTCLAYNSRVLMYNGRHKSMNKIEIGDTVVGYSENGAIVPSEVTDVMKYPPADSKWLKIKTNKTGKPIGSFNLLNCTDTHRIWTTNRGWQKAKDLISTDILLGAKSYITINDIGVEILKGKALGDGHIDRHNKTWAVSYSHSEKQLEYLEHCSYVLGDFSTGSVGEATSGFGSNMLRARTKQTPQIKDIFSEWFNHDIKIVPEGFEFSPISLAYFYMDDGSLSHSDKQKDRANFAVCNFSEESVRNLVSAFSRLDIKATSYKDSEGYFRIRLNTVEAYKMFHIIVKYVPHCMRYKLPEELRDLPYVDISDEVITYTRYFEYDLHIISIEEDTDQHYRYDITTSTSNFIANNTLVHNSGRSGWSWAVGREPLLPIFNILRNTPLWKFVSYPTEKYQFLNGTRRVLVDSFANNDGGFYNNAEFRFKHEQLLRKVVPQGFQVYYEIVGWVDETTPIMPTVSNKKHSKEFAKKYGEFTTFTYGCNPGESKILVYAINYTSPDGHKVQMPWSMVETLCKKWGLDCVPKLCEFNINISDYALGINREQLQDISNQLSFGLSTLDASHIREGVALMIHQANGAIYWLKDKSSDFYILEGVMKSEDAVDMEEVESEV